jgi:hypothetical protein
MGVVDVDDFVEPVDATYAQGNKGDEGILFYRYVCGMNNRSGKQHQKGLMLSELHILKASKQHKYGHDEIMDVPNRRVSLPPNTPRLQGLFAFSA